MMNDSEKRGEDVVKKSRWQRLFGNKKSSSGGGTYPHVKSKMKEWVEGVKEAESKRASSLAIKVLSEMSKRVMENVENVPETDISSGSSSGIEDIDEIREIRRMLRCVGDNVEKTRPSTAARKLSKKLIRVWTKVDREVTDIRSRASQNQVESKSSYEIRRERKPQIPMEARGTRRKPKSKKVPERRKKVPERRKEFVFEAQLPYDNVKVHKKGTVSPCRGSLQSKRHVKKVFKSRSNNTNQEEAKSLSVRDMSLNIVENKSERKSRVEVRPVMLKYSCSSSSSLKKKKHVCSNNAKKKRLEMRRRRLIETLSREHQLRRVRELFRKWQSQWISNRKQAQSLVKCFRKRYDLKRCRSVFTSWLDITITSRSKEKQIEMLSRWRIASTYFRRWNAFANEMKAQRAKARLEFDMKRSRKLCCMAFEFRKSHLLTRAFKSWYTSARSRRKQREIRSQHHRRQVRMTVLLREKKRKHEEARRKEKEEKEEEIRKKTEDEEKREEESQQHVKKKKKQQLEESAMERRRKNRKKKRLELRDLYAKRKRQRDEEDRKEKERLARLEEERKEQAEARRQYLESTKELRAQQRVLARIHNQRRLVMWYGFRPWCARMEWTRLLLRKAINVYEFKISRRLFRAWCCFVKLRKRDRIEHEIKLHRRADKFFTMRLKMRTFVIWKARADASSCRDNQIAMCITKSRRLKHFRVWRFRAALVWREKERAREMRFSKVRKIGSRLWKIRVLCVWKHQIRVWQKEKYLYRRKQTMLKKASRWLEELELDEDDSEYVSNVGSMWM